MNSSVRAEALEEWVWLEVCRLLQDPQNLQQEYQRRLHSSDEDQGPQHQKSLESQMSKLQKGIGRVIDAYTEGVIDKSEFEPRLQGMRARFQTLEAQYKTIQDEAALLSELKVVIGRLEEFAAKVADSLDSLDWSGKRELIRTLVKRVEVYAKEVKVVFKVGSGPFAPRATDHVENWSHCCEGVDFIDSPRITGWTQIRTAAFVQLRAVSLDPPVDGRMVKSQPPFLSQFFHIPVAEGVAAVPTHTANDDCR